MKDARHKIDGNDHDNIKRVEDINDNNNLDDEIKDITNATNKTKDNNDNNDQLVINNINDLFPKKIEVSDVLDTTLSKLISLNEVNAGGDDAKKGLTRLKVDELREMAVTRNLTSNNDASKYKKNDLIKMLQQ